MSQALGSPESQAKGSLESQAQLSNQENKVENNDLERTMFDDDKKHLKKILESELGENCITITGITSSAFVIFEDCRFPISLLEYAVQLIRNRNIPIRWNCEDLHYRVEKQFYIYKNESFWKLIGNGDILGLYFDFEDHFIQLCDQYLQQLQHVQLSKICLKLQFQETEKIKEIYEIIKQITGAKLCVVADSPESSDGERESNSDEF